MKNLKTSLMRLSLALLTLTTQTIKPAVGHSPTAGPATTGFTTKGEQAIASKFIHDQSFGHGGGIRFPRGQDSRITMQNEKILVWNNFGLYRFNSSDGSLDKTFKTDDKVLYGTDVEGACDMGLDNYYSDGYCAGTIPSPEGVIQSDFYALAVQTDQKIIASLLNAIVRYNKNGTRDKSFNNPKIHTFLNCGEFRFIKPILNQNKLILLNTDSSTIDCYNLSDNTFTGKFNVLKPYHHIDVQSNGKVIVLRSNESNNLVIEFYDETGKLLQMKPLIITNPKKASLPLLCMQPTTDNKMLVIGEARNNIETQLVIARYNENAELDASFGNNGTISLDSSVTDFTVQEDGKIVVRIGEIAFVRYDKDGNVDESFGTDGKLTLPHNFQHKGIFYVQSLSDNKILVANSAGIYCLKKETSEEILLERLKIEREKRRKEKLASAQTEVVQTSQQIDTLKQQLLDNEKSQNEKTQLIETLNQDIKKALEYETLLLTVKMRETYDHFKDDIKQEISGNTPTPSTLSSSLSSETAKLKQLKTRKKNLLEEQQKLDKKSTVMKSVIKQLETLFTRNNARLAQNPSMTIDEQNLINLEEVAAVDKIFQNSLAL